MAKTAADWVLDASIEMAADNCNKVAWCSQAPTTFAEANSTYMLALKTVATGIGGGVYTKGDRVGGGRELIQAAQTGVTVTTPGTVTHKALIDTVNSRLGLVTSTSSQAVSVTLNEDADTTFGIGDPT